MKDRINRGAQERSTGKSRKPWETAGNTGRNSGDQGEQGNHRTSRNFRETPGKGTGRGTRGILDNVGNSGKQREKFRQRETEDKSEFGETKGTVRTQGDSL